MPLRLLLVLGLIAATQRSADWVIISEADKIIRLTRHTPADVLLCLPLASGEKCDLIQGWVRGKRPD